MHSDVGLFGFCCLREERVKKDISKKKKKEKKRQSSFPFCFKNQYNKTWM